jgi:hypothetical protein
VSIYDPAATGRHLNIPEAIAREEGWNLTPPARCRRNCNPGNIVYGKFAEVNGGSLETGPEPRFAAFPDAPTGFAALVALLGTSRYAGKSLSNAIENWAPPVENQTSQYLANVCTWTGLTPDTIIDGYLGQESPAVSSEAS